MSKEGAGSTLDPAIGLCSVCRFVKRQDTRRGAVFYRCGRADEDASFFRYPPIPVGECHDGDRKTLKNLLAKDVFDGFASALDERAASGEVVQTNFVGIENIEIKAAELRDHDAHVTVSVVSQLISATRDKAGEVIEGDPESVVEVSDVWTFARDVRQKDPNWKLVATESDD